jgi:hypothetical protein
MVAAISTGFARKNKSASRYSQFMRNREHLWWRSGYWKHLLEVGTA